MNAAPVEYRCPGESYSISRALHLGRLSNFYAACRTCPHREDTVALPRHLVAQLAATTQHAPVYDLFTAEGYAGIYQNQLSPARVRQLAAALGVDVQRAPEIDTQPSRILIAGDDRPSTPELIAAAAEGLRWAGCYVIDLGSGTVGSLALALDYLRADGAIYLGNPTGAPQWAGLKFWGPQARPYSRGGGLDRLRQLVHQDPARPTRRSAALERVDIGDLYRASLADRYHALRPLRVVLDTSCRPLWQQLAQLTSQVACELIPCRTIPIPLVRSKGRGARSQSEPKLPWHERRLLAVARQVVQERAHFGMWIDGDGDVCHIVDEQGRLLPGELLFDKLVPWLAESQPHSALVLEADADESQSKSYIKRGLQITRAEPNRESMFVAMQQSGALLGGGASGRIWFGGTRPQSDALRVLTELLCLLSQSDQPLSAI